MGKNVLGDGKNLLINHLDIIFYCAIDIKVTKLSNLTLSVIANLPSTNYIHI